MSTIRNVIAAVVCAGATLLADAGVIRVSQESAAGAGDFDANVLGAINAFGAATSAYDFYKLGAPDRWSYNGHLNGGPDALSNTTQLFFVEAMDGLSLVQVHDAIGDGSGGRAKTRFEIVGDTAEFLLVDDNNEGVTVENGGTRFTSRKKWSGCCTDGDVIGAFDGAWSVFASFLETPKGISEWLVTDAVGTTIGLELDVNRRVRFDVVRGVSFDQGGAAVPEPGVLALVGLGVLGLGWVRRCVGCLIRPARSR